MLRRAFTLVELLVVVAILSTLAALVLPVLASARGSARQTACTSNLRQLGMALGMYVSDYDDHYVPNGYFAHQIVVNPVTEQHFSWADLIYPYSRSTQVFDCPAGGAKWTRYKRYPVNYTLNHLYTGSALLGGIFGGSGANDSPPLSSADVARPARTVFCGDGDFYQTAGLPSGDPVRLDLNPPQFKGAQGQFIARHHGGCGIAFLDGHSKWMKIPQLGKKVDGVYIHFAKTDDE